MISDGRFHLYFAADWEKGQKIHSLDWWLWALVLVERTGMAQVVIQLLLQYIKDSFLTEGLNKPSGAMLDMLLTHKGGLLGALTLLAALAALTAM